MSTMLQIAAAAAGGSAGGAMAGFVAAVLVLRARALRNHRLVARGAAPLKDLRLPTFFVPLSAFAKLLGGFVAPARAATIGALAPAGLLALLGVGGAVHQTFEV